MISMNYKHIVETDVTASALDWLWGNGGEGGWGSTFSVGSHVVEDRESVVGRVHELQVSTLLDWFFLCWSLRLSLLEEEPMWNESRVCELLRNLGRMLMENIRFQRDNQKVSKNALLLFICNMYMESERKTLLHCYGLLKIYILLKMQSYILTDEA